MIRRCLVLTGVLLVVSGHACADEWRFENVARVVAISDVHGAYDAMNETLQRAAILDENLRWIGGETHLVITGDILDRGPDSRPAMDLLIRLEGEAVAAGGRVHMLIGNHESMVIKGDMRYVSKAEYEDFAADESEQERARWFGLYAQRHGSAGKDAEVAFDKQYPKGYFAMRRAFRPDARYGNWLLQKNVMVVINDTVYVHGGLPPLVEQLGVEGVNRKLRQILRTYAESLEVLNEAGIILPTDSHYDHSDLVNNFAPDLDTSAEVMDAIAAAKTVVDSELLLLDGPLWYRANIVCQPLVEGYRLDAALEAIGADRVVVGHTPTPNRQVLQRFDGRLIEIDTGMLGFYYSGQGHALIIEGDSLSVTAQDGSMTLPQAQMRWVGRRDRALSSAELESLLASGDVRSIETVERRNRDSLQRTIVTVGNEAHEVRALFSRSPKKDVHPGAAAYQLDRLLGLDMVPVTVVRYVDGRVGSLQFLPENVADEVERSESGENGGWCSLRQQWPAMSVFDVLIYNEGRLRGRMLYDRSDWKLMLSGHDRTFSTKKGRPPHLRNVDLSLHAGWRKALATLTDEVIDAEFSGLLDNRRRKALKTRRDELLAASN